MPDSPDPTPTPFLGLRTAIYPAPDLAAAKRWATAAFGIEPYFDADFYVGYSVGGFELALDPNADPAQGVIVYWGVQDVDAALRHLVERGATPQGPVQEVGDGIRTATFTTDAMPAVFGIIENPHFEQVAPRYAPDGGPGR